MRFCLSKLCYSSSILVVCLVGHSSAQEIVLPKEVMVRQQHIPNTMLYGILFRHAAAFCEKANEMDRAGEDGSPYRRHLQHKFNLSATQLIYLDEAALQYQLVVEPIDKEIAESAARYRSSIGVFQPGHPPPLPPEAHYLLAKRLAAIASVRDRFHSSLGDEEFARVDNIVKKKIADNITGVQADLAGKGKEEGR